MLGRPHVNFRGLGYGLRQLVDRIEDAIAGDLCEVHHGSSDCLVAPLLLLVQQRLLRLVQGQFRDYSGSTRKVAAFHTVALYLVVRLIFLAEGDGPLLTVAGDVHSKDSQHVAHVEHLEPTHQFLLKFVKQSLDGARKQNVVHIERLDDEAMLILVDRYARIRLERAETASSTSIVPIHLSGSAGDRTSSL